MTILSQFSRGSVFLSPQVQALFPTGIVAAEMQVPGDAAALLPEESHSLRRAVPKRVGEFAAGRICARRALAEFGIIDFPIRVADDRQPIWPQQMVGSITHTSGFCAAAIGEKKRFAGIGLDSEVVGHVGSDIWPTICVPRESEWLSSLRVSEQSAAAALLFSAKEAFYKCQYPLAGEWLDFHDLFIEAEQWGVSSCVFAVHPNRRLAVAASARFPVKGRYLFHDGFITTGVVLEQR